MADFVAVIRRAVDGLANNTPEMRLRVYDKARGAVQRQLEGMKPRPSDDMLRRQMDKLEAAIVSVEAEHAEAAPAHEPETAAAVAAPIAPPPYQPEPPVVAEPAPLRDDAASSYPDSAYQRDTVDETYRPPEPEAPVYEPIAYEPVAPEPIAYEPPPVPAPPAYEPPETEADPYPAYREPERREYEQDEQPLEPHLADRFDHGRAEADAGTPPHWNEPGISAADHADPRAGSANDWAAGDDPARAEPPYAEDRDRLIPAHEPVYPEQTPLWPEDPDAPRADHAEEHRSSFYGEPETRHASARLVEPLADYAQVDPAPKAEEPGWFGAAEPRTEPDFAAAPAWADPVELPRPGQADGAPGGDGFAMPASHESHGSAFDAHFEAPVTAAATARMPAVSDLPEFGAAPASAPQEENDPFAEYLRNQPEAPAPAAGAAAQPTKPAEPDPWNDLEELIGYNKAAAAAAESTPASQNDELNEDMMPPRVRPYRAQPKPKRSFGPIILALLGLVIVAGGGYVAWANWDTVDQMIGSVTGSDTTTGESAEQTAAPTAPTTTPAVQPPAATPSASQPAPTSPAATGAATAPAADGTTSGQKFTQRLLANGSEVDEGAGGPQAGSPGQSVAQLNSPPGTPATTASEATPAGGTAPADAPAVNPTETAAVSGEKMFLYEERLGQPAPTAVEGNVSWSLQREPGENGRPEPTVQARINIPGRGLTALVTFKRNADPSLPASHLIELVFSVPADFEGGAIDSVQRIAMKDTEQDRGTPLVAVPAKITDDFHMIALNDFPDARATNLELLRSKNWLDIPLAYRNGRRALLTLQKGPEGVRAFDTAIREWSTLAPATGQ